MQVGRAQNCPLRVSDEREMDLTQINWIGRRNGQSVGDEKTMPPHNSKLPVSLGCHRGTCVTGPTRYQLIKRVWGEQGRRNP